MYGFVCVCVFKCFSINISNGYGYVRKKICVYMGHMRAEKLPLPPNISFSG